MIVEAGDIFSDLLFRKTPQSALVLLGFEAKEERK